MKSVHTDAYKAVLEVVIVARRRARFTQQQLADRLEKPQSFVSKYETGERRLDVAEFLAILHALRTDPHDALAEILAAAPFTRRARTKAARSQRAVPRHRS
jgi:transcriptional regulator with XRE-family HTH domain